MLGRTNVTMGGGGIQLSSIAITTQPTKLSYIVGDLLDLTGIEVTATYSNGTTLDVTQYCVFSPANGTELTEDGTITVTATYSESGASKTDSFTVKVTSSLLPVGYVQLSYIESHGTEWINTGRPSAWGDVVELDCTFTKDVGNWNVIFGATNANNTNPVCKFGLYQNSYKAFMVAVGNVNNSYGTHRTASYPIDAHYGATITSGSSNIVANGETVSSSGTVLPNVNAGLFASNNGGSSALDYSCIRLKTFKVTNGGTTVQEMIPAIRLFDGEVGLYDLVSETFFTNQGTGTFGIGAVIDSAFNADYQQVEYLQGNGSSTYINTHIKYVSDTTIAEIHQAVRMSDETYWGSSEPADKSIVRFKSDSGKYRFYSSAVAYYAAIYGTADTNVHVCKTEGRYMWDNGTRYSQNAGSAIVSNNADLFLFAYNSIGGASDFSSVKYRQFSAYDSSQKLFFVPCYNKTTEVAGMYDLVSKTLFTNAGTGNFALGSEVNP